MPASLVFQNRVLQVFTVIMLQSGHELTVLTEEEQNEEYRVKIERIFEIVLDDGDSLRSKFHDE
mgnify:FL=1